MAERPDDSESERYVAIGDIARPHGLRGQVRIRLFNPESELLQNLSEVRIRHPDDTLSEVAVEAVIPVAGAAILSLGGLTSRDDAEALRGSVLEVPRSALDQPEEDEYYVCDLIGAEVSLQGQPVGRVKNVASYPTCDALIISRRGRPDLEVPMHGSYISAVRLKDHIIELVTLDGLDD